MIEPTRIPQAIDSEATLLGGLMLWPDTLDEITSVVIRDDFLDPWHRDVFVAIMELADLGKPADEQFVREQLHRSKKWTPEQSSPRLMQLMESQCPPSSVLFYAEMVRDKSIQRQTHAIAIELARKASENEGDPRHILNVANESLFALTQRDNKNEESDLGSIAAAQIDILEASKGSRGQTSGFQTGFNDLDEMLGGLEPGQLLILAARPAMGKTTLAVNIMERVASRARKPVPTLFMSLEMSKDEIARTLLASVAGCTARQLKPPYRLTDEQFRNVKDGGKKIASYPIWIQDPPSLSGSEFRAAARRAKQKHNIGFIIVDYLQLMSGSGDRRQENRQQEISVISRTLKSVAREMKIPIIALSQLNRGVELRDDKRPKMSDLRESGSIEQDADVVMLLHRDDYYEPHKNPGLAQLIIAKQRSGPTGELSFVFDFAKTRFLPHIPGFDD